MMDPVKASGGSLRAVLKGLNLSEYADLLESEDLDLEVLADINEDELQRIGVKTLGQRTRILQAAKDAAARSERNTKNHSTKTGPGDATAMTGENGSDEDRRKDSEADLEKTLGQQTRILQAAKDADARSEEKAKKHSTEQSEAMLTTKTGRGGAAAMTVENGADEAKTTKYSAEQTECILTTKTGRGDESVENGADEGGRKDSEADVERKRIKDKFETFMKNRFFKVSSKTRSDSNKNSSDEGMSTSGGRLYTAALLSLKMMEKKWQ